MRYSIHIDAGYLWGALATRETGSSNRAAIAIDESALIKALIKLTGEDSGLRLLRVHWYDAARDGIPDANQRRVGLIDSVKLRMGRISPAGDQKGVDLRLGLDLVSLGVNRAVETAYLISGDDDLTEAVADAQELGVQIKLIAVPTADGRPMAVAGNLSLAVDTLTTIPDSIIEQTVHRVVRPAPAPLGGPPARVIAVAPAPAIKVVPPVSAVGPGAPAPARTGAASAPKRPCPMPTSALPRVTPTLQAPQLPLPQASPVYSTTTGAVTSYDDPSAIDDELIAEVARSVFDVWSSTASGDELTSLASHAPNIPPQIDRILLTDMVTRSGVWDIPTHVRFGLRQAFWVAAGR